MIGRACAAAIEGASQESAARAIHRCIGASSRVGAQAISLPTLAAGGYRQCLPGGDRMDVRAAVARAAGKPLTIETVRLEGPRAGEVLVELRATGVCHTDAYTLSGADPEGIFPSILGHEGAGVVLEVGKGVTSVAPGDHVIPLYTPECRQCKSCLSRKTNLCTAIRATQGKGVMP